MDWLRAGMDAGEQGRIAKTGVRVNFLVVSAKISRL